MPTTKKSKPAHPKKISHPEPPETDIEMDLDEEEAFEEPRRMYSAKPPYLLIVLLMAISFFAGYLLFKVLSLQQKLDTVAGNPTNAAAGQQVQAPRDVKAKKPSTDEHWRGSKNARYVWINYSDYECPFCKRNHPDLQKMMQEYEGKVAWIYRHYPLPFHPKAQKSAEGSECAAELGGNDAFWKYTDEVFEKMPDIELTQLRDVAADVGIDPDAFQQCVDSGKYEKKVKDQSTEGTQAGVQATPTGVVYDTKTGKTLTIEGALPYDSIKQQLDDFITKTS